MHSPIRALLATAIALGAIIPSALLAASPPPKGEVEILKGTDSMTVEVSLRPLEPLTPALRALLAFYALRANGGCPPGDWSKDGKTYEMSCPLTTALGLGFQCSEAHLGLVKTWFKEGIPPLLLDRKEAARIAKEGDIARACNSTPYSATHQTIWSSIKVLRRKDGTVTITGEGDWTAGPEAESGSFRNVGTYRLLADRVEVVSFREE